MLYFGSKPFFFFNFKYARILTNANVRFIYDLDYSRFNNAGFLALFLLQNSFGLFLYYCFGFIHLFAHSVLNSGMKKGKIANHSINFENDVIQSSRRVDNRLRLCRFSL